MTLESLLQMIEGNIKSISEQADDAQMEQLKACLHQVGLAASASSKDLEDATDNLMECCDLIPCLKKDLDFSGSERTNLNSTFTRSGIPKYVNKLISDLEEFPKNKKPESEKEDKKKGDKK